MIEDIRKQHNRVSGGSAPIHRVLIGGAYHRSEGLSVPTNSTIIKPGSKAAQHWNLTQCPFYRSPTSSRCVACARPRHQLDLYRIMPRSCISARSPADYCANYGAQLFHPVEVSISQARSPNAMPRRHASPGTRKRFVPRNERMLPFGRAITKFPCHQSIIVIRFSPRHTRQPLHEAANLLYNHYRYL